jgi:hypothetical protein
MSKARLLAVLAITIVVGMLVPGCKDPMGIDKDVGIAGGWDTRVVYPLYNGDDSIGTVTVWNTLDSLYVQYDVDGDNWLEKTDLSVMTRAGDIPQRDGNPGCGQFEFRNTWNEPRRSCTYTIPYRAGWGGKEISIATHCEKTQRDCYGHEISRHHCWGGRHRFGGRDRCHYIKYRFQCFKDVHLPCGSVSMSATYADGTDNSYWTITLTVSGRDAAVWAGPKLGWCADPNVDIDPGTHTVTLYSTARPNLLPTDLQNAGWDNVNYLLNNKPDGASKWDIQLAIWYLFDKWDSENWGQPSSSVQALIDDATAHGNGWYPTSGEVVAVILKEVNGEQLCFIEVDP